LAKKFLRISFKTQLLETASQKQKEQRQKQQDVSFSDVFSLPVHFVFLAIFSYCLHVFCQVCLLVKKTAEIDQEWQNSQLVPGKHMAKPRFDWTNRKKISQLSKTTFTYCSTS
jgi:hypothetical protein